jgi:hypothetical protein
MRRNGLVALTLVGLLAVIATPSIAFGLAGGRAVASDDHRSAGVTEAADEAPSMAAPATDPVAVRSSLDLPTGSPAPADPAIDAAAAAAEPPDDLPTVGPSAGLTNHRSSSVATADPTAKPVPTDRPDIRIRLACELATHADQRGVVCKWSEADHPAAAGYVLYRSVDGGAREKIYRTGLDGRRGFFDTKIRPGQSIRYAVIVVNRAGERIGRGGPVVVRIPPRDDATDPPASAEPTEGDAVVGSRG